MAHNQHIPSSRKKEERCQGCHVWGHIHEDDEVRGWGESSNSSHDTITQESYLESYMASQMDKDKGPQDVSADTLGIMQRRESFLHL